MMCDNLSLYKSFVPSTSILPQTESTAMNSHFFPAYDDDEHRLYTSAKRKLSGLYLCAKEHSNKVILLKFSF